MHNFIWVAFLFAQIVSYGSYAILVNLSKVNGRVQYNTASINFLVELFKLIFSLTCYLMIKIKHYYKYKASMLEISRDLLELQQRDKEMLKFSFEESVFYVLPAFLYFINNNLDIYILHEMDTTTFQILINFKILTTAALFYFIMGKTLTRLKWLSLFMLFIAGIFHVFGNLKSTENTSLSFDKMFITKIGVIMMLIFCFISGFASVYNEYLLKRNFTNSIFIQNTYLYVYGVLFNFLTAYLTTKSSNIKFDHIFYNFNHYTWFLMFTQVFTGFSMSVVLKHSSSITRLFIISSSLLINVLLSFFLFSLQLNVYFYATFFIILFALFIYLGGQ